MSQAETPEFSVIIPVYNRAEAVQKALHSLKFEHCTKGTNFELIIVDDGSQDGSSDIAREVSDGLGYGDFTRVIVQDNAGPGAARNTGAKAARANTLIFLDSDDYWFPHALDVCIEAQHTHPDATLFFLPVQDVAEFGVEMKQGKTSRRFLQFSSFLEATTKARVTRFASCNLMISRKILIESGGFTTEFRCSEDSDLFLRIGDEGPCVVVDGPPIVAHVVGEGDHLSNQAESVEIGLKAMMKRNAAGLYPGRADWRRNFFAGAVVYTCRMAFAQGEIIRPYKLLAKHIPLLFKSDQARWSWRLLLFPLLSLLSPHSYRFGKGR